MKKNDILPDVICSEFGMSDRSKGLSANKNKENFSGILKVNDCLQSLGYRFDYVKHNNAYFSKKSFWAQKQRPKEWFGEDEKFLFWGTTWYDKQKLKDVLASSNELKQILTVYHNTLLGC